MNDMAAAVLGLLLASTALADPFKSSWREIAPGVHVGIRDDSTRVPVMGTTTFVVSEAGVVVFDGGGVPVMSERAIEKIRATTELPVTHVVISHWHQDHNWGIRAFADEWPHVQIVSHPYTRQSLLAQNPPALERIQSTSVAERQLSMVEEYLASGKREPDREWLQQFAGDMDVLDREYKRIDPLYPNLTFEDRLVIHSGSRILELRHPGKGNTAGDVILWLPEERIVVAGDLVVRPTPYGFGSHPAAWAESLRALKRLDFKTLVPGHGDLQHDARYLDLLIETLELVAGQAEAFHAEGLSEEEAIERLDLSSVEERFTGNDAFLAGRFREWFKKPIARAAYRIAAGEEPEV